MKIKEKIEKYPFPAWLFVALTVLYNELMLHIWTMEQFLFGRFLAVAAFALGLGGALAFLTSLLPKPKAAKWLAVALAGIVTVFWLVEYFVSDAYQVFMTPGLILGGAGGVAQDYMDLILSLLLRNLWRIAMMGLPVVLYALFFHTTPTVWKHRAALAAFAVLGYLAGIGAVHGLTNDAAKLDTAYNFDSAVRSFGLHVALALETTQSGRDREQEPAFVEAPTTATVPATEAAGEPEGTEPETVDYGVNVIGDLDMEALLAKVSTGGVGALHRYVSSLRPSSKNEYTGLFEGKNLILITAEAFTAEVIDPELTPTLYRMANEGIRFEEYYQPAWGASTTSGEFSNLFGLVPSIGGMCMNEPMEQHMFLTMGYQLKEQGYYGVAYHNHNKDFYNRHKTHLFLGYDKFLAQYGGLEGITPVWPESDLEMIDITVPQYIDNQPFSIYYMTVSGHSIYVKDSHAMAEKNYDKVEHLAYSDTVKCYLAANLELENAMASLLRQLEEAGIADDTVVVLATDHYPYGLDRSGTWKNPEDYLAELFGVETYDQFTRDHNALIIWSGCIEDMDIVVDTPVYSLDILPTVSNLFGVEYDSRLLVGRDVFSDREPLALWPDHSWVTDKGRYNAQTGIFTPNQGVEVDESYVEYISSQVANKITYSKSVQELNYFNYIAQALGKER